MGKAKEHENVSSEETAFIKGISLEKEFSDFMKRELRWQGVKVRATVNSFNNARGTNVDIIAWGYDAKGRTYRKAAIIAMCIAAAGIFVGLAMLYEGLQNLSLTIVVVSGIIEVVGFLYLYLSRKFKTIHAWVECKNLKTHVSHRSITHMLDKHMQYNATKEPEYKFRHLFFVTTSGFIENALKTALDNQVNCYIRDEHGIFKKITSYWD